jgi:hypothetical protein
MTGKIIDFKAGRRASPRLEQDEFCRAPEPSPEETARQTDEEAARIVEAIRATPRLSASDRRLIARNFGGLIEKHFGSHARGGANEIFLTAYGESSARSMNKKRRRYFRFSDEELPPSGEGEAGAYATKGAMVIGLFKAFQTLAGPDQRDQAISRNSIFALSRSTSFTKKATRLTEPTSLEATIIQTHDDLVDRIIHETDIASFIEETHRRRFVYKYTRPDSDSSKSNPSGFCDRTPSEMVAIPRKQRGVLRKNHPYSDGHIVFAERGVAIPIGRLHFPRQILAFDAPLSNADLPPGFSGRNNDHVGVFRELALEAIRNSGFCQSPLDWSALETDHKPARGTHWINVWIPRSLRLIISGSGAAKRLSISVRDRPTSYDYAYENFWDEELGRPPMGHIWAQQEDGFDELAALRLPSAPDDWFVYRDSLVEGVEEDFEVGNDCLISGRFGAVDFFGGDASNWSEDCALDSPDAAKFLNQELRLIEDFEQRSSFDQDRPFSTHSPLYSSDHRPVFIPSFDAPPGPTPAEENSLAELILRSLAYSEGPSGLYPKIKDEIDRLVDMLTSVRNLETETFELGMRAKGFGEVDPEY